MATRLRIKELLTANGLTAYQLAQQSGKRISLSAAYRLRRNTGRAMSLDVIDALCEVLRCDPGDLFERDKNGQG